MKSGQSLPGIYQTYPKSGHTFGGHSYFLIFRRAGCNIVLMNCLLNHTRFILVFLFISWSLNAQVALPTFHGVQKSYPSVLIIWDDSATNTHTVALKTALGNAGFNVTMSNTSETSYDGTNPALSNFNAVIHLDGTTFGTRMPTNGQTALVSFVNTQGGLYIHNQWLSYENYSSMLELVLFTGHSYHAGSVTIVVASGQSSHAILSGISFPLTLSSWVGNKVGNLRHSSDSTVLLKEGAGNHLVIRPYGNGKIVAFSHAANYNAQTTLSNSTIQQLYINAIEWAN